MPLYNILVDIATNTAKLEAGMRQAEAAVTHFGDTVKQVATLVGVGLGLDAFVQGVTQASERIEQLGRVADRLGTTTEEVTALKFAGDSLGVSFQELEGGLTRFYTQLNRAEEGSSKAGKAVKDLGLNASLLLRLPLDAQLETLADALSKVESGAKRTALETQLFGQSARALDPLFRQGAAGIKAMIDAAQQAGVVLTGDMVEKARQAEDAIRQAKIQWEASANSLTIALAPAIKSVAGELASATRAVTYFGKAWIDNVFNVRGTEVEAARAQMDALVKLENQLKAVIAIQEKVPQGGGPAAGLLFGGTLQENKAALDLIQQQQQRLDHYTDSLNVAARDAAEIARIRHLAEVQATEDAAKAQAAELARQKAMTDTATANEKAQQKVGKLLEELETIKSTLSPEEYGRRYAAAIDELFKVEEGKVLSNDKKIEAERLRHFQQINDDTMTQTERTQATVAELLKELDEYAKATTMDATEYGLRQAEIIDLLFKNSEGKVQTMKKKNDEMSKYAEQAARNIQDAFANFLFDPFSKGLDGMLKGFLDIIRKMVAEILASKILEAIGAIGGAGGGSGWLSTALTALAGGASGARASGGPVSAGGTYLVGERGPELLEMGSSEGEVVPGGAGGMTFAPVYHIDARGADAARIMSVMPRMLNQASEKAKRDILDSFHRNGLAAPRSA